MRNSRRRLFERLDYRGRFVLTARYSMKQAWGVLLWPGAPEHAADVLPDGRSLQQVLSEGRLDTLPPCFIRIFNTGAYGDMMWTGGGFYTFVSDRFVDALKGAGIGGYQTLPLEVHPKHGEPATGYRLLLPDNADDRAPIRSFPFFNRASWALDVSAEVMDVLRNAGVTGFGARDAQKEANEYLEYW